MNRIGAFFAIAAFSAFLWPSLSFGKIKIFKTYPEKHHLVLQNTEDGALQNGGVVEVTYHEDTCELTITSVKGKWAAADSSQCSFAEKLKGGMEVRPTRKTTTGSSDSGSSRSEGSRESTRGYPRTRWAVGLYLAGASEISEKLLSSGSGTLAGASGSTTTTYNSTSALGLTFRGTVLFGQGVANRGHLGVQFGLNYEGGLFSTKRKIASSVTDSGSGTNYTDLKFSLLWPELSSVYEYNHWYGLLGFNYSFPSMSGTDYDPALPFSGALGVQLGAGYDFKKSPWSVELLYRTINASRKGTYSSLTVTSEYERLWGVVLRGTYSFGSANN